MDVIAGKNALVTGAASGIGRAIAVALAAEGANLFIVDRNPLDLEAARREIERLGVSCHVAVCDLAKSEQIASLVRTYRASSDRLDILVNGAGLGFYGHAEDMSADQWQSILAVNLLAPVDLVRQLLPMMIAQRQAHIVNVCSIVGLVPARKVAAYQTSKFGLVGFTMALRAEYGSRGLGVTAICPGIVHTPMVDQLIPGKFKRLRYLRGVMWTSAEVVAARSISAIRKNTGLVVITPFARAMWGLSRLSPRFVVWLARAHRRIDA